MSQTDHLWQRLLLLSFNVQPNTVTLLCKFIYIKHFVISYCCLILITFSFSFFVFFCFCFFVFFFMWILIPGCLFILQLEEKSFVNLTCWTFKIVGSYQSYQNELFFRDLKTKVLSVCVCPCLMKILVYCTFLEVFMSIFGGQHLFLEFFGEIEIFDHSIIKVISLNFI